MNGLDAAQGFESVKELLHIFMKDSLEQWPPWKLVNHVKG